MGRILQRTTLKYTWFRLFRYLSCHLPFALSFPDWQIFTGKLRSRQILYLLPRFVYRWMNASQHNKLKCPSGHLHSTLLLSPSRLLEWSVKRQKELLPFSIILSITRVLPGFVKRNQIHPRGTNPIVLRSNNFLSQTLTFLIASTGRQGFSEPGSLRGYFRSITSI